MSWDFLRSPNIHIALSALHRLQGLEPSHLDFFRRHLSQALHTRFLTPRAGGDNGSAGEDVVLLPMMVYEGAASGSNVMSKVASA